MTLTQASALTKKIIVGGIIFTILGGTGFIGYNIWHQNYLASLPKVEEQPEMGFGKLPTLQFPSSDVSSTNYSYSVDTSTGDLPEMPKLIKVYFIPRAGVTLLAPEKSQRLANQLGFIGEPEKPSPTDHRYKNDRGDQLNIDLITGNFHYQKAESTSSALLTAPALPKEETVIQIFKDFLFSSNLLPEDINSNLPKVAFNQLPATVDISFLPADIDNLPVITPTLNQGLIKAVLAGTDSEDKTKMFLSLDYIYWPVDKTTFSTYPLKSVKQAFADLKSGQSLITQEPLSPQVSIASVRLAYYESEEYNPYLQPVFIFEGPNFTALVPALK